MPPIPKIKVLKLSESIRKAESMAEFGRPIDKTMRNGLLKSGLKGAAHRASNCLGWIWRQWLAGIPRTAFATRIEAFVDRGLKLRALSQSYDCLALHDLYLLHCVIFGSSDPQIKVVAERVADTSGDKGKKPLDNGELCRNRVRALHSAFERAPQSLSFPFRSPVFPSPL